MECCCHVLGPVDVHDLMKAKVYRIGSNDSFDPVKVEIVLESKDEVIAFNRRMNLGDHSLDHCPATYYAGHPSPKGSFQAEKFNLWWKLDDTLSD